MSNGAGSRSRQLWAIKVNAVSAERPKWNMAVVWLMSDLQAVVCPNQRSSTRFKEVTLWKLSADRVRIWRFNANIISMFWADLPRSCESGRQNLDQVVWCKSQQLSFQSVRYIFDPHFILRLELQVSNIDYVDSPNKKLNAESRAQMDFMRNLKRLSFDKMLVANLINSDVARNATICQWDARREAVKHSGFKIFFSKKQLRKTFSTIITVDLKDADVCWCETLNANTTLFTRELCRELQVWAAGATRSTLNIHINRAALCEQQHSNLSCDIQKYRFFY